MSIVLADYGVLAEGASEMEALRKQKCPRCKGQAHILVDKNATLENPLVINGVKQVGPFYRGECPTCKGTGLNPDQSKWWEALARANMKNELIKPFPIETRVIFCEAPVCAGLNGKILPSETWSHRPESDNRPWPEVLAMLIQREIFRPNKGIDIEPDKPLYIKKYDISLALATRETAHVFKSFGIKTLIEA